MAIIQNEVLRPITTYVAMAARISALITVILLLILSLHYKGGLSLYSSNPSLIINVSKLLPNILPSSKMILTYTIIIFNVVVPHDDYVHRVHLRFWGR